MNIIKYILMISLIFLSVSRLLRYSIELKVNFRNVIKNQTHENISKYISSLLKVIKYSTVISVLIIISEIILLIGGC